MLLRRQVLAASTTTLPLFLGLAGCAGHPNPLTGPPPLSPDVRTLMTAATAEDNLVYLYTKTIASYSGLATGLSPLLAEHQAHLSALRARIIEPPGRKLHLQPPRRPATPATEAEAVARLRAAEQAALTAQLGRLPAASAAEAQLYASIATSEATHITVLKGLSLS
ncbi:MAG TPA: hypothetical protein VMU95_06870 [Trebonia sp.]|nr:hypothetical protein [Trebonia sp.]